MSKAKRPCLNCSRGMACHRKRKICSRQCREENKRRVKLARGGFILEKQA